MSKRKDKPTPVCLALQGGGAHGAFTWGVLDTLLQDSSLRIAAVSGTSAGAMNAAVLACGLAAGGAGEARARLASFWQALSQAPAAFGRGTGWPGSAARGGLAQYNLDAHPLYAWAHAWMQWFSPYQLNPLNLNALRTVLAAHVSDAELAALPLPVFATATAVRSGQPEVFAGARLSVDALLASACLPQLFQAVEVGGEPYWDGGFVGNPALWPLFDTGVHDIVLVQLDPLHRRELPTTAVDIADRVNEITFNASLSAEMRAIRFVQRLAQQGQLPAGGRYHAPRLHRIADDEAMAPLTLGSKYNTDPAFLQRLHGLGQAAAQRWLRAHRAQVGRGSSCDIGAVFLGER
jgi:NTE family protein